VTTLIGGHLSALPFAAAAVPAPAPGRQAASYGDSLQHVYASVMEGDAPADWASCAGCCAFCGLAASWDEAISALELPHPMLISRV